MRYIKIRAKNYNDAMMKLKMEHGDDAIPISHKYVKEGGFFKSTLFAKEVVELTAAVQEKKYPQKKAIIKNKDISNKVDYIVGKSSDMRYTTNNEAQQTKHTSARHDNDMISNINKNIDALNDNLSNFKTTDTQKQEDAGQNIKSYKPQTLEKKLSVNAQANVQSKINNFEKEFNDIKAALNKIMGGQSGTVTAAGRDTDPVLTEYYTLLKNNDFESEECHSMIDTVKRKISHDELKDKYKIEKSLKDLLKSKIVTTGPIDTHNTKKVMMFIGPTGVGKTTTMAKLGAIYSLRENKKVIFITIDNYRIAATEQLKKYAEIMKIPVFAINSQTELKEVITKENADIIMIDTSGRSHKNESKLVEIKKFSDAIDVDFEKVLCVSATTKKQDLNDVFKSFGVLNYDNIIITKVDETSFIGNVVNVADKYNKPISYFTNGQEVPNDIVVADPDNIVDMIMG